MWNIITYTCSLGYFCTELLQCRFSFAYSGHDDMAESPTQRAPGYHDFTSPQAGKEGAGRKKRLQPVLARGRARSRGFSGDDGKNCMHCTCHECTTSSLLYSRCWYGNAQLLLCAGWCKTALHVYCIPECLGSTCKAWFTIDARNHYAS